MTRSETEVVCRGCGRPVDPTILADAGRCPGCGRELHTTTRRIHGCVDTDTLRRRPLDYLWWLFFSPDGRIGRGTFALAQFALLNVVWGPPLVLIIIWRPPMHFESAEAMLLTLGFIPGLLQMWPALVLCVKRLNDRRRNPTVLFWVLLPVLGGLWLLVELFLLPGRPEPYMPSMETRLRDPRPAEDMDFDQ